MYSALLVWLGGGWGSSISPRLCCAAPVATLSGAGPSPRAQGRATLEGFASHRGLVALRSKLFSRVTPISKVRSRLLPIPSTVPCHVAAAKPLSAPRYLPFARPTTSKTVGNFRLMPLFMRPRIFPPPSLHCFLPGHTRHNKAARFNSSHMLFAQLDLQL
jgi:hypothetical protein